MTRRRIRILSGAGLAAGLLAASYPLLWRDRCLHWGARPDETAASFRGDELLPCADVVTTRAITIEAQPKQIWPWLVQMGSGRAGTYTYDWIENLFGLDMHSAEVILPQFQDLRVGDEYALGGVMVRVEALDPDELLVTRVAGWHWVRIFCLIPENGSTRLVLRNRLAYPGIKPALQVYHRAISEAVGALMERKMLLGIKARAESEPDEVWPEGWPDSPGELQWPPFSNGRH